MNNKKSNNNQLLMTLLKGRTFIVLVLLVIFFTIVKGTTFLSASGHLFYLFYSDTAPTEIYTDHGCQARSPVWNPCTWYDLRNHYRWY